MSPDRMLRFVFGRGLAGLGDQFLLFAVPLLVFKATGSVSKSGLVFLIEWLPRVFFLPVAGVLADRKGGYIMYVTADVARAVLALTAFGAVTLWPSGEFLALNLMVAGMALAGAQAYVAMEATLPRFVPGEQMVKAQATIQGIEQLSEIAGPAIAAVLAAVLDTRALLLVTSVVFALTAANVFVLRAQLRTEVTGSAPGASPRILRGVREGADVLRSVPALTGLIGLTMAVNLMVGIAVATSAAITTGTFHEPDHYFGALTAGAGLAGVLTFTVVPRLAKRFSPFTTILSSYVLICIGGLGIGRASTFLEFALSYALLIGMIGSFNVFIRTERIRRIPADHLGKTIGLIIVLNQISLPIAGFTVAAFASSTGAQAVMQHAVIGCISVAFLLLPLLRKLGSNHETSRLAPHYA